jgi:hypothetical protein
LKLRPRYELDDRRRIVRMDSAPIFDVPPALDDLLRLAAKNYFELEQGFYAERTVAKATRALGLATDPSSQLSDGLRQPAGGDEVEVL